MHFFGAHGSHFLLLRLGRVNGQSHIATDQPPFHGMTQCLRYHSMMVLYRPRGEPTFTVSPSVLQELGVETLQMTGLQLR